MIKIPKKKIDGVLLFNKPLNISSNQVLQKIKHLYNAEKAGHTGTLDPMASGLLPICFGEATKFSSFLLDSHKEYIATIKLGIETTTYDSEGDVVAIKPVSCSLINIENCLLSFTGLINQTPPIYSALKLNGKPLYQYARSGIEVEVKSRQIEIAEIELLSFKNEVLTIRVLCSKGTYIRSLAHDIGCKLGCGASLINLVRTKTSTFKLNPKLNLDHIISLNEPDRLALLLPIDVLVTHLPKINLNDDEFKLIQNGHSFKRELIEGYIKCCLFYEEKFLGIAICDGIIIQPIRLLKIEKIRFLITGIK